MSRSVAIRRTNAQTAITAKLANKEKIMGFGHAYLPVNETSK